MDSQTAFEEAFAHRGPRWVIEDDLKDTYMDKLCSSLKSLLKYEIKNYPDANVPNINLDFIMNDSVQAEVKFFKGEYFIAIYIGAIATFQKIFFHMLASPEVLKNFGAPDKEIVQSKMYSAQGFAYGEFFDGFGKNTVLPIDKERGKLAIHLIYLALRFLVLHELGHIIKGHLRLQIAKNKNFSMQEFDENNDSKSGALNIITRQTLEMDADAFASTHSFGADLFILANKDNISDDVLVKPFIDETKMILLNAFAIYTFFRLGSMVVKDFRDKTHPPAILRQAWLMEMYIRYYDHLKLDSDLARSKGLEAIKEVENAFRQISEVNPDEVLFLRAFDKDYSEHNTAIFNHWYLNVAKMLRPYAYTDHIELISPEEYIVEYLRENNQ